MLLPSFAPFASGHDVRIGEGLWDKASFEATGEVAHGILQ
jgi:hypothetical protein